MDHVGFLNLTAHFIRLFKSIDGLNGIPSRTEGEVERRIDSRESERIVVCYRTWPAAATCPERSDRVGRPAGAQWVRLVYLDKKKER